MEVTGTAMTDIKNQAISASASLQTWRLNPRTVGLMEVTGTAMTDIKNQAISASASLVNLQMLELQTRLQRHQSQPQPQPQPQPQGISQTRQRHYAPKMVHVMATLVH